MQLGRLDERGAVRCLPRLLVRPLSLPCSRAYRLIVGCGCVGQMDVDIVAKRVSSLPPHLRDVLACLSEGMSNGQIAERLGYKNARTVGTLVYEVNRKLGLERMFSRTEQRQLASDAFRAAHTRSVRIKISPFLGSISHGNAITLDPDTADRMRSLQRQGYEIEALEVILRQP